MNSKEFQRFLCDWYQFRPESMTTDKKYDMSIEELDEKDQPVPPLFEAKPILEIIVKNIDDPSKYNEKSLKNFIDSMPSFELCKTQKEAELFVEKYTKSCILSPAVVTSDELNLYVEKLQKIHFGSYKDWVSISDTLSNLIQNRSQNGAKQLKDNFEFALKVQKNDHKLTSVYLGM